MEWFIKHMDVLASQSANARLVIGQIIEICKSHKCVSQALLFGSRAKGTAMERSDIDIALIGHEIDIEKLRDDVDKIETLLRIDLVDISKCGNGLLKSEVAKDGIPIYSKV
jgi:predicted nucleotidyltransferase